MIEFDGDGAAAQQRAALGERHLRIEFLRKLLAQDHLHDDAVGRLGDRQEFLAVRRSPGERGRGRDAELGAAGYDAVDGAHARQHDLPHLEAALGEQAHVLGQIFEAEGEAEGREREDDGHGFSGKGRQRREDEEEGEKHPSHRVTPWKHAKL